MGNEYISGTGNYAKIKEKISPSSFDRHNYPEWKESKVLQLLEYLESNFIGQKIFKFWEKILNKIPDFRSIYSTLKQLIIKSDLTK